MLVQPGDIDVGAGRLADRASPGGADTRDALLERLTAQSDNRRAAAGEALNEPVDRGLVLGASDVQCAPLREHAVLAQVAARCQGQRDHVRTAVTLLPERGRAAGRMITGLRFGFRQQDLRVARQFGSDTGTGHSRADDGDVVAFAHWGTARSRKSSIAASALSRTGSISRSTS